MMKRIGLLGGLTWHSTAEYYRLINQEVNNRLGGQHSAEIAMVSLDFETVLVPWQAESWDDALARFHAAVQQLQNADADFFLICTNTVHMFAPQIAAETSLPLLHIADAVAAEINQQQMQTVGLVGTKLTMQQSFYTDHLAKAGINTLVPYESDCERLDNLIFNELAKGEFNDATRNEFIRVFDDLKSQGAQGIILACTEIPLLFQNTNYALPLFDTVKLHALAAVDRALQAEDI